MKNVYVCGCFQNDFHNKTYDDILHNIFMNHSDYSIFVRIEVETIYIFVVRKLLNFVIKPIVGISLIKHVAIKWEVLPFHVLAF